MGKQGTITKRELATQHYGRIDPKWRSVDADSKVPPVCHGHVSFNDTRHINQCCFWLGKLRCLVCKSFAHTSLKDGSRACIGHRTSRRGTGVQRCLLRSLYQNVDSNTSYLKLMCRTYLILVASIDTMNRTLVVVWTIGCLRHHHFHSDRRTKL